MKITYQSRKNLISHKKDITISNIKNYLLLVKLFLDLKLKKAVIKYHNAHIQGEYKYRLSTDYVFIKSDFYFSGYRSG